RALLRCVAALGECAKDVAEPARLVERRARSGRLLLRTAQHGRGALLVQNPGGGQPADEPVERLDGVAPGLAARVRRVIAVHEIQPQPLAHEDVRVRAPDRSRGNLGGRGRGHCGRHTQPAYGPWPARARTPGVKFSLMSPTVLG